MCLLDYRKTFGNPWIDTPEAYSELNTVLRATIIARINFEMREANNRQTAPKLVLHFQEDYRIMYHDPDVHPDDVVKVKWVNSIVLKNKEEIRNETWALAHEHSGAYLTWGYIKDHIPTDTLIEILRELQRLNNHPISEVEEVEETND